MAGVDAARLSRLQALGVLSGVTAGAWLGAAEAPTKLVTLGIPPVAISFVMDKRPSCCTAMAGSGVHSSRHSTYLCSSGWNSAGSTP